MKIVFRTNASNRIGLGHLTRSISLINLFKNIKSEIFVDKPKKEILENYKNIDIRFLYNKKKKFINELDDAKIFSTQLSRGKKDIVFIDDYRLGYVWEKYVSNYCKKIICIDDFINRKHFADVFINTKPDFVKINKKDLISLRNKNKKKCIFLLGPKFYLPIFKTRKLIINDKNFFCITFYNGGSGNILIYKKIIKKIINKNQKKIRINLIIGPLAKNLKKIKNIFSNHNNIKIIYNPPRIDYILNKTDLLISSAGMMAFEAATLNVTCIIIKMSKNQDVSDQGLEYLGHYFLLKKEDILKTNAFSELIFNIKKNFKRIKHLKVMNKKANNNLIKLKLKKIILNG